MRKPTILLAAAYEGYRTTLSLELSERFSVITASSLPRHDESNLRRSSLIFIVNLWKPFPGFLITELAETTDLPMVVMTDHDDRTLHEFERQNPRFTVLPQQESGDRLVRTVQKILSGFVDYSAQEKRSEENILKKSMQSAVFRRRIDKVLEYIGTEYKTIVSIEKVAEEYDLNYKTMCHAISRKTGRSPQEYLRDVRLKKMMQYVQYTMLEPDDICCECGLKDTAYGKKLFRRSYGLDMEKCIREFRENN